MTITDNGTRIYIEKFVLGPYNFLSLVILYYKIIGWPFGHYTLLWKWIVCDGHANIYAWGTVKSDTMLLNKLNCVIRKGINKTPCIDASFISLQNKILFKTKIFQFNLRSNTKKTPCINTAFYLFLKLKKFVQNKNFSILFIA